MQTHRVVRLGVAPDLAQAQRAGVHAIGVVQKSWRLAGLYLEAVDSQAAPSLIVAALQIADDAVVHILLLLSQEVCRDSVQGVAAQLVVTLYGLQQVELDAAIDGDLLVIVCTIGFAAELGVSHAQLAAPQESS